MQNEQFFFEGQDALFQGELENTCCWVGQHTQQEHISCRGGGQILAVPSVEVLSEDFTGDGARNEMSTRQGDMAIVMKHALPIMNVLLEHFTAALPMVTPTEMKIQVTWSRGQGV